MGVFEQFIDVRLLPNRQKFITSQSTQAWLRMVLGIIFSLYIYAHGPYFDAIFPVFVVSILFYQSVNLITLYWIKRKPYSISRLLLMPVIDCFIIFIAMWADGGHMSVAYVLLLSPIFGNGFRYGSYMLRYCQIVALITMISICLITTFQLNLAIDWLGLAAEIIGILYLSSYGDSLVKKNESTTQARVEAEDSASRLIAETPHPAFTFDSNAPDTPILYANPAMAQLTPDQPEALIGMPIHRLVIKEDREALIANALSDQTGQNSQPCYVRMQDKNGENIQLMCEIRRTKQSGKEIGLAYLTNISESERLQGALVKAQNQAFTAALASGIAHDFRNLLSGIIGHAELITLDHDDASLHKDINEIIVAGNHGCEMVEQLLQMGRSNQADAKVQDIADSINRMIQLARVQLPPDIALTVKADENLPLVCVNIAQIEQVLLNLISNSAQSMPDKHGLIKVSISRHNLDTDTHGILLSIRDNGRGIDADQLQSIFKPFWSTRKDTGGTGLGLAMVQRIIRWHKGSINVESIPGEGSLFNIFLPEHLEQDQLENSDSNLTLEVTQAATESVIRPWNLLLVEDQVDVMYIHNTFLTKMGHSVQTAVNGKLAFDIIKKSGDAFDMILTDYMMPEMDGIALTKAVREFNSDLPITIVTAFGEDDTLDEIKHENTYFMNKPLSYHQLHSHLLALQNA
ncbi:two-component system, NtrC family, sensor kinase [Mariprofundus micogutta]|uniref:histidine kinase n=1 Tax=Mariprofundus micogutta TaxID=1921010 RepID=A0A1L8CKE0_9PROT|nr:ATP-binding protein [Mariprofundus micogutta]GAV19373.1 two-component system, NtrC family, sensor kinase [Mariprofundus micogutta]